MTDPVHRLRPLAAFADVLASADFDFGHWVTSTRRDDGVYTMPYFELSQGALDFLAAAPLDRNFDWPPWQGTDEAQSLMHNRAALEQATPEQLVRLLTALVRGDRFTEGNLAAAFEAGLLAAIARRAAAIVESADRGG
jgi:hypothetical protein